MSERDRERQPPVMPPDPDDRPKPTSPREEDIDESVEESFPASDPPAVGGDRRPRRDPDPRED